MSFVTSRWTYISEWRAGMALLGKPAGCKHPQPTAPFPLPSPSGTSWASPSWCRVGRQPQIHTAFRLVVQVSEGAMGPAEMAAAVAETSGEGLAEVAAGTRATVTALQKRAPFWHSEPTTHPCLLFFVCGECFVLCFAHAIERQFLQLSYSEMPLPWDSCCHEKMALTLKQKWHCAT